jgi:hypothetical protein
MERKDICFATFARNEKDRLPIWLSHYSQFADNEDIYVFDQSTTDGSTDNLSCNVIPEPNEKVFDHKWIAEMLNRRHRWLLDRYKIVVLNECDELLITKNSENLREYLITKLSNSSVPISTELFDIVQNEEKGEINYDITKKISEQRNYWRHWPGAQKHTISSVNKDIFIGLHQGQSELDNNLMTIHTQLLNLDFFKQKIFNRIEEKEKFGNADNHACWDVHYKVDMIQRYLDETFSLIEEVPDWFKNNKFI